MTNVFEFLLSELIIVIFILGRRQVYFIHVVFPLTFMTMRKSIEHTKVKQRLTHLTKYADKLHLVQANYNFCRLYVYCCGRQPNEHTHLHISLHPQGINRQYLENVHKVYFHVKVKFLK